MNFQSVISTAAPLAGNGLTMPSHNQSSVPTSSSLLVFRSCGHRSISTSICALNDDVMDAKKQQQFSHLDGSGRAQMVDVSAKVVSFREARASARVRVNAAVWSALKENRLAKGNAFNVAELAGIQAAKRTAELIPLCHQVPLSRVSVRCVMQEHEALLSEDAGGTVLVECTASTSTAPTGVEMEALTGAALAALTLYDMCKALDRGICVEYVRLDEKRGGASGHYQRHS